MPLGRAWVLLFPCVAAGSVSCGEKCPSTCPVRDFVVVLPRDRASDVASAVVTGPCGPESVPQKQPGVFYFTVSDVGVCHVTVSFRSGVPDFVTDVKIIPSADPCCGGPEAERNVNVPELEPADASTHD